MLTFRRWWSWEFWQRRWTKVSQTVPRPSTVSLESRCLDGRHQTHAGEAEVGRTEHQCLWFSPRHLRYNGHSISTISWFVCSLVIVRVVQCFLILDGRIIDYLNLTAKHTKNVVLLGEQTSYKAAAILTIWQSIFTARPNARIASVVLATAIPSVCLSVCPSVCHTPVLCQNDGT